MSLFKKLKMINLTDLKFIKKNINSFSTIEKKKILIKYPKFIKYIEPQTAEFQIIAIKYQVINNHNIYKTFFNYIKNPTNIVLLSMVSKDPYSIQYMETPPENVQSIAIRIDPDVIKFIKDPSEKVQLEALEGDPFVIRFIKNPQTNVILYALKLEASVINHIKNLSDETKIRAISNNPNIIKYIKNPSEKLQLLAVNKKIEVIKFIKNPTNSVIKYILEKDPYLGNCINIKNKKMINDLILAQFNFLISKL